MSGVSFKEDVSLVLLLYPHCPVNSSEEENWRSEVSLNRLTPSTEEIRSNSSDFTPQSPVPQSIKYFNSFGITSKVVEIVISGKFLSVPLTFFFTNGSDSSEADTYSHSTGSSIVRPSLYSSVTAAGNSGFLPRSTAISGSYPVIFISEGVPYMVISCMPLDQETLLSLCLISRTSLTVIFT